MEELKKYKEYYEIYDKIVMKMIPFYPEMHSKMMELFNKKPDEEFAVIDAGCGTGTLVKRILHFYKNAQVIGIDINEDLAQQARDKLNRNEQERFHFMLGNFNDVELEKPVDIIVSSLAIHHLDDREKEDYFKKMYSQVKSGGKIIIADIVKSEKEEGWHSFLVERLGEEGEYRWQKHKNNPKDKPSTIEDQLVWLKNAGFKNVRVIKNWFNFYLFVGEK